MENNTVRALVFDTAFINYLAQIGIDHVPANTVAVHSQTLLEPPVSLYGLDLWAHPTMIGAFTYFGPGQFFNAEIGRYCSVGAGLRVGISRHPVDHLTTSPITYVNFGNFQSFFDRTIKDFVRTLPPPYPFEMRPRTYIGNDVWIGADVYIKDGLKIGDGAIIGAGSVVTRDVEPYHIVGGNPARTIRQRFPDSIIEKLLALKWWKYNIYNFDGTDARDVNQSIDAITNLIEEKKIKPYEYSYVNLCDEYDKFHSQKHST